MTDLRFYVMIILLITVAGCDMGVNTITADITLPLKIRNTSWKLTSLHNGTFAADTIPQGQQYSLQFYDSTAGGMNDCNEYWVQYSIDPSGDIEFSSFGATKIYCGDSMDDAYRETLLQVRRMTIDSTRLQLLSIDQHYGLVFQRIVP